jgi:hypothetical protein
VVITFVGLSAAMFGLAMAAFSGRPRVAASAPAAATRGIPTDPPFTRAPETHPRRSGESGIVIHLGRVFGEEDNDDLIGKKWFGDIERLGIADVMVQQDAHVRASLETVKAPIRGALWGMQPARASSSAQPTPAELEHADFVRSNLLEDLCWDDTLRKILDYAKAGFSLLEFTSEIVEVPAERFPLHPSPVKPNGMKDAWRVTGFEQRLPRTIDRWNMDPEKPGCVKSIRQWVSRSDTDSKGGYKDIDARDLLRFTFDQQGNNPEGFALLRSAYKAWKIKVVLEVLDSIRHERQNVGVPKITLPAGFNEADRERALGIVEKIRGHERVGLVLPNGFQFSFDVSGSGAGTNVGEAIERCNRDIWMNVQATFMLLGNGDTGSYALAETLHDVHLLNLEGHCKLICDVFNIGVDAESIVRRAVRLNYGVQPRYPRLMVQNLPTRDWQKIIPVLAQGCAAGLFTPDDVLEDHLRVATYTPPRDPSTARKKAEPPVPVMAPMQTSAPASEGDDSSDEAIAAKVVALLRAGRMAPARAGIQEGATP